MVNYTFNSWLDKYYRNKKITERILQNGELNVRRGSKVSDKLPTANIQFSTAWC